MKKKDYDKKEKKKRMQKCQKHTTRDDGAE